MIDIKEVNDDISKIAAQNNVAVFVLGDLFNENVKNHFHYDYQKFIQEVSRIYGRDMTQELINLGYLRPLPYGEYEINLKYNDNTMGQKDSTISIISSLSDDLQVLYHEAAHVLQNEYNLFQDKDIQNKYGKDLNSDDIYDYKLFLGEQHAESFSYAAMMLRSKNPLQFAKVAFQAWRDGVSRSHSAFTSTSDNYKGKNASSYYATFPVMIKTIKKCFKIHRTGKTKDFFSKDGRLDDKKVALMCQDIVYQSAYSPQRFKSFFKSRLKDKADKLDYIYKKGKMKFLKTLAFFKPEEQGYYEAKEQQRKLFNDNIQKIEKELKIPYIAFLQLRDRFDMQTLETKSAKDNLGKALVYAQNVEDTKLFLQAGADVNAQNEDGKTALMRAQTPEQTKLLLKAGANVNAQDTDGNTALMFPQNLEQIKLLLKAGADVNVQDKYGDTALMGTQDLEKTKLLLKAGANVNVQNKYGDTALMKAKTAEKTKLLIEAGANVNVKNNRGQTALMFAQTAEQTKLLLAAGADINAKDEYGRTVLMKAETAEQTKLLLESGVDVNDKDGSGFTALMAAATAEQTKLLLAAGADVNVKSQKGETALMSAQTPEQTKLLLEAGADVNAQDEYGRTALLNVQHAEQTKLLLEAGADVNKVSKIGVSALMLAQTPEQTKLLLKAGADVNAKAKTGATALIGAQTAEQTKLLLEAGADVNVKSRTGHTALMLASSFEQAKLLLEAGAEMPEKFERLYPYDIEKVKLFVQELQQKKNQNLQQNRAQENDLLNNKSVSRNEGTATSRTVADEKQKYLATLIKNKSSDVHGL